MDNTSQLMVEVALAKEAQWKAEREAAALREKLADIAAKASVASDVGTCDRVRQAICEDIERLAANAESCGTCADRRVVCGRFSANQMAAGAPGEPCPDCAEGEA